MFPRNSGSDGSFATGEVELFILELSVDECQQKLKVINEALNKIVSETKVVDPPVSGLIAFDPRNLQLEVWQEEKGELMQRLVQYEALSEDRE